MDSSSDEEIQTEKNMNEVECPVCLQIAVHPTKLPCGHIFCYLCLKGVVIISHRCALCRRETTKESIEHPELVFGVNSVKNIKPLEDGYQWFYEGRNGWWQYDERTSNEIESAYKSESKTCTIFVAGFIYIVDFETMMQRRQNDPAKKRAVKRDLAVVPKKGIAGIRFEDNACSKTNTIPGVATNILSTTLPLTKSSPPPTITTPPSTSSNSFFQFIRRRTVSNNDVIDLTRNDSVLNNFTINNQPSSSGLNNVRPSSNDNNSFSPQVPRPYQRNSLDTSIQTDYNYDDRIMSDTLERMRNLTVQSTINNLSDDSDSDHV